MNTQELSHQPANNINAQASHRHGCSIQQLTQFLGSMKLFMNLEGTVLNDLASALVRRRYEARETIFYQGDPGTVLYIIYSGQVRIFVNSLDGTETSLVLVGQQGEIFGDFAVIDGLPRSANAVAMKDTVLFSLSRDAFQNAMLQAPQIAINFMSALSRRLRYSTHQVDSLATMDVARRLASKLLELGRDYGMETEDGLKIQMPLNQSEMASLIGATRESTNKVLRVFRTQNIIRIQDGLTTILDSNALKRKITG